MPKHIVYRVINLFTLSAVEFIRWSSPQPNATALGMNPYR